MPIDDVTETSMQSFYADRSPAKKPVGIAEPIRPSDLNSDNVSRADVMHCLGYLLYRSFYWHGTRYITIMFYCTPVYTHPVKFDALSPPTQALGVDGNDPSSSTPRGALGCVERV